MDWKKFNDYVESQKSQQSSQNQNTAQSLTDEYGVPVSYNSTQELNSTGEGLGLAKSLYGENMGDVGKDAANYSSMVKANLGKDYAGADKIRQQSASQVAKVTGASGLSGTNNLAMQNQLYRQGAMSAQAANQDYQDKALAAYGRNVSARQSGESSILMGYKGLGTASTPSQTPNYSSGLSIICTELYCQGKISKETYIKASIYGKKLPENTFNGYIVIATPIVKLMKKYNLFSCLFVNWAKCLAKNKPNILTRILLPVCWSIGYVRKITKKETFRVA